MAPDEFDLELQKCASVVESMLRERACKTYLTTAYLVYPDRLDLKGLVSETGEAYSFEAIYEFGKALAAHGTEVPPFLFVAAEAETGEGDPCVFVSGATPDGRRSSMHIELQRSRWRRILRPTRMVWHGVAPELTSAGELMRGLLTAT
jgi:hypothetical protein